MKNNLEYVLPLGKPNAEGNLTSPSWRAFVQWIFELADDLVIWTHSSRSDVNAWLSVSDAAEIVAIPHLDPACALVGYRLNVNLLSWERVAQIRVSEDSGVAFFSWQKDDVVLASVEVDDFENFAVLDVDRADAAQLAKACLNDAWDSDRFLAYKEEIDALSTTGQWLPLSDALNPRG